MSKPAHPTHLSSRESALAALPTDIPFYDHPPPVSRRTHSSTSTSICSHSRERPRLFKRMASTLHADIAITAGGTWKLGRIAARWRWEQPVQLETHGWLADWLSGCLGLLPESQRLRDSNEQLCTLVLTKTCHVPSLPNGPAATNRAGTTSCPLNMGTWCGRTDAR
jgi:hypothetical protein